LIRGLQCFLRGDVHSRGSAGALPKASKYVDRLTAGPTARALAIIAALVGSAATFDCGIGKLIQSGFATLELG